MTQHVDDVGECVDMVLRRVGPQIVLALPLGIGKPNLLANEFYRRAARDPSLDLTIVTALSLRKPGAGTGLEKRFLGPLVERVFGDYPDLEYAAAMRENRVPPNIRVIEFYLEPGAYLDSAHAQQNYLSTNYTHVVRDVMARGVNVVAHLVAKRTVGGETQLSLGSNPDVTQDLLPLLERARRDGREAVLIGQVHRQMPFMLDRALIDGRHFDYLIDSERHDHELFCPPNPALGTVDHAIGLHASALVRDGGTLQIGIGELGDAIVYALLLRHQQNNVYRQALQGAGIERSAALIDSEGGREAFNSGLFASTEMFVDQILDLYRAGILSRRVYDSLPLQRLIVRGELKSKFDVSILPRLVAEGIGPRLSQSEFDELRRHGVFRRDVRFDDGRFVSPSGEYFDADLSDATVQAKLAVDCLGRELQNGHVLHAGFFLGPRGFYAALRDMPDSERRQFAMRGVSYINQLYGADQELRTLQRQHARHVNTCMMVTLLGAAVSDGLADGRVVSGVGGQYNFVCMAHALPEGRSILCVRATRTKAGKVTSNLVWNYGHVTIPRHLRDIVITEYGIADLRGKTDQETIAALLNIADSRFQEALLAQARSAGKIASDYRIPEAYRSNTPAGLEKAFVAHRAAGFFSEYPFGTDLTADEIVLARALKHLKARTPNLRAQLRTIAAALIRGRMEEKHRQLLRRMGLEAPLHFGDRVLKRLVVLALRETE
jgi:acyl-CoA hydrolase